MRKLIDIPDKLIDALKQAASEDNRSVKSWIENQIITTLREQDSKQSYKRTKRNE